MKLLSYFIYSCNNLKYIKLKFGHILQLLLVKLLFSRGKQYDGQTRM